MFQLRDCLSILAVALATACAPNQSTIGQRITCETDPDSGVILSCEQGEGDGGDDSCDDIDEDGDGQPHDDDDDSDGDADGQLAFTEGSDDDSGTSTEDCDEDDDGIDDSDDADDDNDGVDDADDCDEHEGEDGDESELPYDVELNRGDSVTPVVDAFAEKGGQPAAILSIEMDGGGAGWRLAELQAGATFTVTDADCTHLGNRDVGRDRVLVTWRNADGGVETDHLDLRYCGR